MARLEEMQVLGVDGCTKGWVAVVCQDDAFADAVVADSLSELVSRLAGAEAIGVDIPIGLPSTEPRPADDEAKRFVGPRRSSVFPTPPREALPHAKKTWNGQTERLRLLEEAGIAVPRNLDEARRVPPDDVLDAAVAAWTATRIARGEARTLPAGPPKDPRGRPVAIWY